MFNQKNTINNGSPTTKGTRCTRKTVRIFVKLQCFYASLNFLSNFIGLNYSLKITFMQSKFQKDFQSKQLQTSTITKKNTELQEQMN